MSYASYSEARHVYTLEEFCGAMRITYWDDMGTILRETEEGYVPYLSPSDERACREFMKAMDLRENKFFAPGHGEFIVVAEGRRIQRNRKVAWLESNFDWSGMTTEFASYNAFRLMVENLLPKTRNPRLYYNFVVGENGEWIFAGKDFH